MITLTVLRASPIVTADLNFDFHFSIYRGLPKRSSGHPPGTNLTTQCHRGKKHAHPGPKQNESQKSHYVFHQLFKLIEFSCISAEVCSINTSHCDRRYRIDLGSNSWQIIIVFPTLHFCSFWMFLRTPTNLQEFWKIRRKTFVIISIVAGCC